MAASIDRLQGDGTTVPLGPLLARSARFKSLFAEGMDMVEEAATYLDGPGREDARALRDGLQAAYSAESMRLTTRLMQIASWLLLRRAILDGEGEPAGPETQIRFKIASQGVVTAPTTFALLPPRLQSLANRSLRLQSRIVHLDGMVNAAPTDAPTPIAANGPSAQFARLRAVYGAAG